MPFEGDGCNDNSVMLTYTIKKGTRKVSQSGCPKYSVFATMSRKICGKSSSSFCF